MPYEGSWFFSPQRNETASNRLFCFHYAGGNAHIFYSWAKHVNSSIELVAIQLPGHGTRFTEPLLTNINPVIDSLGRQIEDYLDKPFFFFGHSLGGLIAYALTHYLQKNSLSLPGCLFVSGKMPPHLTAGTTISHLSNLNFLEEAKKYNGVPQEALHNKEFLDVWLPILRADFQILETYTRPDDYKISCDLMALGGIDDTMVTPSGVDQWRHYTTAGFNSSFFPGGHFFINTQYVQVIKMISNVIHNRSFDKIPK